MKKRPSILWLVVALNLVVLVALAFVQIPLLSRLAMLESGKVKSLRDLAAREGIDNS